MGPKKNSLGGGGKILYNDHTKFFQLCTKGQIYV